MPGIIGYTKNTQCSYSDFVAIEMQEMITHHSFYVKDDIYSDQHISCSRSHINAIQKGIQPYFNKGLYIWLDGEFYNQNELGHFDKSCTDTEILAYLYQEDRELSFLKRIDGLFVAVIYDQENRRIHLISDRFGLRHMYWAVHKKNLIWSSELKSFLAIPDFTININEDAVNHFFEIGHLLEDETWFCGVELLPSGTVVTWDLGRQQLSQRRYWWWDEIEPLKETNEKTLISNLGDLFVKAVERRLKKDGKIGMTLSGGLDSRAIFAALPENIFPMDVLTFGKKNAKDISIARKVVQKRNCTHHIVELNADSWLTPRIDGIWWTDGQKDLLHMHVVGLFKQYHDLIDINLNGFLGDALLGGSYLTDPAQNAVRKFYSRGRRLINMGTRLFDVFVHNRMPFFDNDLMEYTMAIPESLRKNSYIYNKMLLKVFPSYFSDIEWQKTGYPIGASKSNVFFHKAKRRLTYELSMGLSKVGISLPNNRNYTDYPNWIRLDPAKGFFIKVLLSPDNLYQRYISKENVHACLNEHLTKGKDYSNFLCRSLTFEIWLQQVYNKKYRQGTVDEKKDLI